MGVSRKLIIGFDGRGTSEDALALGKLLAELLGAEPLIVAAFGYPYHLLEPADREKTLAALGKPVFDNAVAFMQPLGCETLALADDSPAHGLNEVAEEQRPIAIVIGSAHKGAVGRLLAGSVGRSLLSGAPCAVAVAPRGFAGRKQKRPDRIGVAINGSPESRTAFSAGVALAERLSVELELLAATAPTGSDVPGAILSILSEDEIETAEEREMRAVLEKAEGQVPAGVSVRGRLLAGEGVKGLVKAAEHLDLLIVGSRGYGPLRRALMGSTSTELMRTASAPILVLPRGAGEDPLGSPPSADLRQQEA